MSWDREIRVTLMDLLLPYFGSLREYLVDDSVSEILVNPNGTVFVESAGRMREVQGNITQKQVEAGVLAVARSLGRNVDEAAPLFEGRFPDGSRVSAVFPPCSEGGIALSIRKFAFRKLTLKSLLDCGTITREQLGVVAGVMDKRGNVLISGGTGAGKTSLLCALAGLIQKYERIVTIEDVSELQLDHVDLVRLTARLDGNSPVTLRDLLRVSMRLHPERIILGECRGAEALEFLLLANSGHDGTLMTVHARSAKDALHKIHLCCMLAPERVPSSFIQESIGRSIALAIHMRQTREGKREVSELCLVHGYDPKLELFELEIIPREAKKWPNGTIVTGSAHSER